MPVMTKINLMTFIVASAFFAGLNSGRVEAAWSSGGGGEIIKDARNPWFVQNTSSVNVCVIHDADHFDVGSLDQADLQRMIQDAAAYWRFEFTQGFSPWQVVKIATQNFEVIDFITINKAHPPRPCNASTDLTIQMGYLDSTQKRYLAENGQSPKDFISFATRTEYDPKNLRGKGFVYIAADSGDLKFEGPDLVPKPWSMGSGGLLHAALKHELGHVFGIPHMGSNLMNAGYLESILKVSTAESASMGTHEKDFFKVSRNGDLRSYCPGKFSSVWRRFLSITTDEHCYEYRMTGNKIDLMFGKTQAELRVVGTVKMDPSEYFSWVEAVRIYLTKQEDVYHDCPAHACEGPWLLGPMVKISERSAEYVNSAGDVRKPVVVTFSPLSVGDTYVKFGGEIDGKIVPNLEWGRP